MRRALVTNEFAPALGGVERLLHMRSREFQPGDLTVFTGWTRGCAEFDLGQPYGIRRGARRFAETPVIRHLARSFGPMMRCWREHRRRPFDLVECGQAFPTSLWAWALRRRFGTPYIVWVHGNDLLGPARYRFLRAMLRGALGGACTVVVNSAYTAGIVAALGVDAGRIRTIDPPVDTGRFKPAPPAHELQCRYGLDGVRVILTVCRLVERKGVDLSLEALAHLAGRQRDFKYLVVGDGPMRRPLQALADRLGLADRVVFAGAVPDEELPAHYNLATLFLMPSRYLASTASVEGLGLVFLEAMASGVPVVAGRSGGVGSVVVDGHNGLLVDPGSATELSRAIDALLSDQALAARLGRNGLEFTRRPRDWRVLEVGNG